MCGAARDPYEKSWDPVFSTHREFKENWSRPYVDQKRTLGDSAWDGIELFYRDTEGSVPDCKVEELVEFVGSFSLKDLKTGSGSAGQRQGAWLDERGSPNRCITPRTREHKNPLTATQLYERLRTPRIGDENEPDADRRLIYIENLDPAYMLALAETAAYHEVPLLRDALWKHIAGRTSLKVGIPTKGYKIFQIEFHLRYFMFRNWTPGDGTGKEGSLSDPPKELIDLSFLDVQAPKLPEGRKPGMFEAHFSLVICGSHARRWVAYALDNNTEFDGEELYDKIFPCEGVHSDPIGSCLNSNEIDADRPIWDPREYFLLVVANRIAQAASEWDVLLRAIERKIKDYRDMHPSTLSQHNNRKRDPGETAKTSDWTQQTIELMNRLLKALSETVKFWKDFNDANGDIGYFRNSTNTNSANDFQKRIHQVLCDINESFQALERLQRDLEGLSVLCKDSQAALHLRLTIEQVQAINASVEATKSNGAASDFTLLVICPLALAAAYFSMPQSMLAFQPSSRSFFVVTIIIMIAMKTLYIIKGALPGFHWWWRNIGALMETMKLEGSSFSLPPWSRLRLRRVRGSHDRTMQDVEMGAVPT